MLRIYIITTASKKGLDSGVHWIKKSGFLILRHKKHMRRSSDRKRAMLPNTLAYHWFRTEKYVFFFNAERNNYRKLHLKIVLPKYLEICRISALILCVCFSIFQYDYANFYFLKRNIAHMTLFTFYNIFFHLLEFNSLIFAKLLRLLQKWNFLLKFNYILLKN